MRKTKSPTRACLTPNGLQRAWWALVPPALVIAGTLIVWGAVKSLKELRGRGPS